MVAALALTGVFGAAWAEDDDQITPLAAGASISHDFVKDWSHEQGDNKWDWQPAAQANAGGSAALLAPLQPGIFNTNEEATFSRDRMSTQLDDSSKGLGLHLTEVNDARVLADASGLLTPNGGVDGFLMRIVRVVFGGLLWLLFLMAEAVQKTLEVTLTVVGSLNPARIFIGVDGLNRPPSSTAVDGLTIRDSRSYLYQFWSGAQGLGLIIIGVLGAIGLAASLLGSHKMSKTFRATLTRLLFLVAFVPLAFGIFGAVVDWAKSQMRDDLTMAEDVVLTHMVDTEAWAANYFKIPDDSLCGVVTAENTKVDPTVLTSIIVPDGNATSVAYQINHANGVTSDDASSLLTRWLRSSSMTASDMSAIVHSNLLESYDVGAAKDLIENMIDDPSDEGDTDDSYALVSGGTMTKSGDCYEGQFSPIGTIAFGSLQADGSGLTIKTASSSASSVGLSDVSVQSISMVGQGFNGMLVYIMIVVLLFCPAILGTTYGWGLVSEAVKIGIRLVGHVSLGFFGSLRSIMAAVVAFCGLLVSIIATVLLYILSSTLLGVLSGRIAGSILVLSGSGSSWWAMPVGIILGCVIAVIMTFALIKLRGAIVGGVGAAMARILAKLVGFDDLEAQRAGDEAVAQSGVSTAAHDAGVLGKKAGKGARGSAAGAIGAVGAAAGGLMGRATAAIGAAKAGSGSGSGSGGGSGSGSGGGGGSGSGSGSDSGSGGSAPPPSSGGGSSDPSNNSASDGDDSDSDGGGSADPDGGSASDGGDIDSGSDDSIDLDGGSADGGDIDVAVGGSADPSGGSAPDDGDGSGDDGSADTADSGSAPSGGSDSTSDGGADGSAKPADSGRAPQSADNSTAPPDRDDDDSDDSDDSAEPVDHSSAGPAPDDGGAGDNGGSAPPAVSDGAEKPGSSGSSDNSSDNSSGNSSQNGSDGGGADNSSTSAGPPSENGRDGGGAPNNGQPAEQSAPAPSAQPGQAQRPPQTEAEETRQMMDEEKARYAAAAAAAGAWANARFNPASERRFERQAVKRLPRQTYADRRLHEFNRATAQLKAAERLAQTNSSKAAKKQLAKAQAVAARASQRVVIAANRAGSAMRVDNQGKLRLHHTDPEPNLVLRTRRRVGQRRARKQARKQSGRQTS
ncbi:MAG: hypothetical protein LBG60_13230 [Bifidobacteriaceae bacterium]|nr:hypothetical protein [Bifidobacteriaceae bacterium]